MPILRKLTPEEEKERDSALEKFGGQILKVKEGLTTIGKIDLPNFEISGPLPFPDHRKEAEEAEIRRLTLERLRQERIQPTSNIAQLSTTIQRLPGDIRQVTSMDKYELSFNDGKKLKFTNLDKPIAKYFNLLIKYHGTPVKHGLVKHLIPGIKTQQIRNLVKVLRKKIEIAMLSKRVKIKNERDGAYTLLIT